MALRAEVQAPSLRVRRGARACSQASSRKLSCEVGVMVTSLSFSSSFSLKFEI